MACIGVDDVDDVDGIGGVGDVHLSLSFFLSLDASVKALKLLRTALPPLAKGKAEEAEEQRERESCHLLMSCHKCHKSHKSHNNECTDVHSIA